MHKFLRLTRLSGLLFVGFSTTVTAQSVIHFCGEVLPANHPAIVRNWIKVLTHQAAQAEYLTALKQRSTAVFPIIEPIIAQFGIPADFKYLPLVESGGQNFTVSRRGAAGFWQLMPQTARSLGLSVINKHDERYDLRKSTTAACRYLRELYDLLGSWTLVAAAYNAGPNYVQALRRRFPDEHALALPYQATETKSYVFQAVALKELFTKPQAYQNYLSDYTIAQLSEGNPILPASEDLAVVANAEDGNDPAPDSVAATSPVSALAPISAENTVILVPAAPVVPQLETRGVSDEPLTEGKLCLFVVVRSSVINGINATVGDLVYAHVESMDMATGRAFLRTEKLVSAQTQETIKFQLVATEKNLPGVALPARDVLATGWKLNWQ